MAKRDNQAAEAVEEAKTKKYRVVLPSGDESYRLNVSNGQTIVESIVIVDLDEVRAREMRQRYRAVLEQPNVEHVKPGSLVEWPLPSNEPYPNRTQVGIRAGILKEVKESV
jgi:hypothetical protein